jgi:predicted RND superfamily exporter protein
MAKPSPLETLTRWQFDRPWRSVGAWLLLAALALPFLLRLGLNSDWIAMLATNRPAVRDMELIGDRVGGISTLMVAASSTDRPALKRFAADLVPRLRKDAGELILRIDWNTRPYEDFVEKHRHFYVPLEELTRLRDDVRDRVDFERAKANPLYVWLDDEEPPTVEALFKRAEDSLKDTGDKRHPENEGYFIHPDGNLLVVFIRTTVEGGDMAASQRVMDQVSAVTRAMKPESYAPDMRVDLGGDIAEAMEEQKSITAELMIATSATIVLVLASVLLFFRNKRSVPLLGGALIPPVVVTFGAAQVMVEYLNTSTAFLAAIVIGNGVNPLIIWLARYYEERRAGAAPRDAILGTHRECWTATLTASLAAAVAYGSLISTDFRGFRDFGLIGFVGMVLCWMATMTLLPALVVLMERRSPMRVSAAEDGEGVAFGTRCARAIMVAPRTIVAASVTTGLFACFMVARAIAADPMEYDLNNLRSVPDESAITSKLNDRINAFISRTANGTVLAMLAPNEKEAIALEHKLEALRDSGKADFGAVNTIQDLLPADQAAKRPLLADIREALLEVRKYATEPDQKRIDDELPAENPPPVTVPDLPREAALLFSERDGSVGNLLLIEQAPNSNNWDGRYLVRWTEDARQVRTAEGERPPLTGRPPIFADVLASIWRDGPTAIAVSLGATILLLFFAFRTMRTRALTLGALLLGVAWMGGIMAAIGMKLNFLNFAAFPITFGIGADYGVNVLRRYEAERVLGRDRVQAIGIAVEQSGGAVVLCSLTTVVGYLSLWVSANRAIKSFGVAMAISEVTCLAAAVLSLPALVVVLGLKDSGRSEGSPTAADDTSPASPSV